MRCGEEGNLRCALSSDSDNRGPIASGYPVSRRSDVDFDAMRIHVRPEREQLAGPHARVGGEHDQRLLCDYALRLHGAYGPRAVLL
jgi:hypothetical protein